METILKPHHQIELPQEVCSKLELTPGVRLEIELDERTGTILLVPITKELIKMRAGVGTARFQVTIPLHK